MKRLLRKTAALICLIISLWKITGAEIAWTNTAGGNWNVAANWNPNSVPGPSDLAIITNGGTYTVTVNTAVTNSGLTLGGASGTQTLAIASQTLTLNGPSSVSGGGVLSLNNGTLTGVGDLTVSSQFNWLAGTHSGSGFTTLTSGGVLTISGLSTRTLSGRTLINSGTASWNAGLFQFGGGALFTNTPSGTFDITSSFSLTTLAGGGVLATGGLVRKAGGETTARLSAVFESSGAVEVQSGTLVLDGIGTNSGSFSIASGATLEFSSSGVIATTPESNISGAGNFTVTGNALLAGMVNVAGTNTFDFGTADFTGTYTISGPLVFSGGNANFNGSGTIIPTSLDLLAGVLGGTNEVIVSGLINWTAGDFSGANAVIAKGGLMLDSAGTKDLVGRTLVNVGAAAWKAGPLRLGGGALITNTPSGSFDIAFVDQQSASAIAGGGGFANAGLFRKLVGTNAAVISSGPFTNTGTLEIQAGTLRANSGYTQEGGLTLLNGGSFSSTQPIRINAGTLAGNGIVIGNVTNSGVLSPGVSPGTLTIAGNYAQTGNGALDIELAGPPADTNYDRVIVTGAATLAGTLNVTLTNSFYPAPDVTFTNVVRAASRNGTFGSFNFPSNVVGLQVNYGQTNLNLEIINTLPFLPALAGRIVDELALLNFNVGASDADSPAQSLSYALSNAPRGMSISDSGHIAWTPTESQGPLTTNVTVLVTDNGSPNLTTNQTFEVVAREINAAPMLTLPANQAFNEETIFNATATATESDVPTNALTFELVSGPSGLTVSPAGAIQWTPSEAQGSNSYTVIVRVTDNNPGAFNSQQLSTTNSFDLTVNEVNVAPNLTVPPNQVITEENLLGVSASATDPDVPANPLTFALISPPPGMTIEPNSGAISWTPDESQGSNSYVITVTVADNNPSAANALQLSETNSFIVTVTESNRPPVLILPANQTVNELAALNTNATATDLDLPANSLTFALVSGPSNLTVSAGGEIHWTPAENHGPTTNMVFISVTDGNSLAVNATSLSITGSFDIVVEEVNSAPVLADMSDRIVNPGRTISFIAMAIDADQPTNTLAFSLMNPPIGATIDPASGAFDWRPGVALADTTNVVQVRVQDNGTPGLSDAKSFTVIVNALAPVVLTQVSRPNGQFRFRVSGTEGPDYVVQASTNLTDWTDIATVPAPVAPFQVDDDNAATFSNRFYRVRLQP